MALDRGVVVQVDGVGTDLITEEQAEWMVTACNVTRVVRARASGRIVRMFVKRHSLLDIDDSTERHGSSLRTTYKESVIALNRTIIQHKQGWLEHWLHIAARERSNLWQKTMTLK